MFDSVAVQTAIRGSVITGLVLGSFAFLSTPAHADCASAPAPEVNWRRCHLAGYVAIGEDMNRAVMRDSTFNRGDFSESDLSEIDGRRAKFVSATLVGTQFDGANLVQADFTNADLTGASFRGSDLSRAYFIGANLRDADLSGARLDRAEMLRADFSGATWLDGRTICAEGSIGRCNPMPAADSAEQSGAAG